MRMPVHIALGLATALFPESSGAVPGGEIDTLPHGAYICELPGNAGGPWRIRKPEEDFAIINASNYRVGDTRGSYLLTGEMLTLTSGPFNGKRYRRQADGFLRLLDAEDKPSDLRCVRSSKNSS